MTEHDTPDAIGDTADAELVLRTRSGDSGAFGELWRRHYRSGLTVARSVTSSIDADDLVQEAYARIYQSILKGGGPTSAFRPYLFTSIRNTAAGWGRAQREVAVDELENVEDPATSEQSTADALDRSLTHQAFRSLPTRWQEVLWYTEIEQMKPAEVGPLLGLKATAVAQLAFRAREGLREAWIQAHLRNLADGSDCQWTIERLGAYSRNNLGTRDTVKLEAHLADCARCSIVAAEAKHVSGRLALVLLPLTVGITGAAAYLASLQGGGAPVVALAAMPSTIMEGAVTVAGSGAAGLVPASAATGSAASVGSSAGASSSAGATTAGGAAGSAGGVAAGGAAAGAAGATGVLSGVGAVVGLVAAGVVVVGGAVAGAVLLPGLMTPANVTDAGAPGPGAPQAPLPDDRVLAPLPDESPSPSPSPSDIAVLDAPADPIASAVASPPSPLATPVPPVAPAPDPTPSAPPTPTPTPDPGPVLPSGTPQVTGSTAERTSELWDYTIQTVLSGTPGATIQVVILGEVRATAVVDDLGTATIQYQTSTLEHIFDVRVGFRYVAGDLTGPITSIRLRSLL